LLGNLDRCFVIGAGDDLPALSPQVVRRQVERLFDSRFGMQGCDDIGIERAASTKTATKTAWTTACSAASGASRQSTKTVVAQSICWFWALHFPSKPDSLRTNIRLATLKGGKGGIR
jgi:hypothetical protein